uniref:Apple domain-containing protein n=1 Tax=Heterorhabditis bacteriophora TaxID=37862 RepID=A0A1I7WWV5_HETBA
MTPKYCEVRETEKIRAYDRWNAVLPNEQAVYESRKRARKYRKLRTRGSSERIVAGPVIICVVFGLSRMSTIAVIVILAVIFHCNHAISSSCFYLPNINLKGGTYDEFDANDISACCIACANQPCCVGYTYSKALKRCYMKSAINYSEEEELMISGIRANTNGGMGAKMKNVKIEGSKGSRISLENAEECQQYCTAFGVYSWSPPRFEDGQISGECSCMKRITAVKYSFGSHSAIFPTVSNLRL